MAEIRPEENTKARMEEPLLVRGTVSKIRPVLLINEGNLGLKKNSWERDSCHHRSPAKSKDC
jgi:hypothetical protein